MILITGVVVGFAVATLESGESCVLAKAQLADEVGGQEVVLKCSLGPDDARETAKFLLDFATAQEVRADQEIAAMLDGGSQWPGPGATAQT